MIDLTEHPELADVVRRWTADGEMKFHWPSDNEEAFSFAAYYWTAQDWDLKDVALEAFSGGYGMKIPEGIQVAVRRMSAANEGAAFDAFLRYWDSVPRRNAKDIMDSSVAIHGVLELLSEGIRTYKRFALEKLQVLEEALSENQRWAWASWVPFAGPDDEEIDSNARALIRAFDADMATARPNVANLASRALQTVTKERAVFEQIAKPIPQNLTFDQ
ncbi:hypothetical protein GCM10022226_81430 [Sphaerisporangium flaviroseum]|uniref:Uncharacterized protein n=1 Tax=Sphaerisporangium flaviroseum TaxID=509199 RepID=A0ABP7JJR3_9ACTN